MTGSRIILITVSAFLVLVMLTGGVVDLAGYVRTSRPFPKGQVTRAGILDGESQEAVEAWLREESTIAAALRPAYHEVLHMIGRTASPEVVVGRDMLFYAVRVLPFEPAFWANMRSGLVDAAVEVQRGLEPWGGRVLVVMVPDTIRVYPDQLPGLEWAGSAKAPYYGDVIRALEARGVAALDLVPVLMEARRAAGERVYRADDHHWSHLGCRAAARATADWMRRNGFGPGADLNLRLSTLAVPDVGSVLRASGWDPMSPLARPFRSNDFRFDVRRPSGRPYVEPWVADVVVASDSFGGSGFAGVLAKTADHRVADICAAGKGPFYSLFELLEAINEGWRPKLVVWLFEERASYGGQAPFEDWVTAATVLDLRKGIREHRFPTGSVRTGAGATASVLGENLAVRNESKQFELRLPRPPKPASHVVCYVRPPILLARQTTMALIDADAGPMEAKTRRSRALVLDGAPDVWQRIILPVPPGSGDLVLAFDRDEIGGEFLFQSFGWIAAGEPPPEGRLPSMPLSDGALVRAEGHRFVDDPSESVGEVNIPTPDASRYGAHAACSVSTRFIFHFATGDASAAPATLIVDGSACPTPEPVVFTIESGVPFGPAVVDYQIEITSEPGRVVEVPAVLPFAARRPGPLRTFHVVDVRMTSTAEARVVAAVRLR